MKGRHQDIKRKRKKKHKKDEETEKRKKDICKIGLTQIGTKHAEAV